jgi:NAD-dependent deacetylase
MATVEELYDKIKEAKHCVALTGAGISTLSGIRDFRGKGGIYTLGNAEYNRMFDLDLFEQDPSVYYRNAKEFIYALDEKDASIVHFVCAKLEKAGLLKAIITQNIDMLHQKGGAKHVIEVHGSATYHYCLRCPGVRVGFDEVREVVQNGGMPKCPKCGRVLKPAITFFGEMLPELAIREATKEAQDADLMLILGTSLTVWPAAGIPEYVIRNGGELVIVNNQPTSLDRHACMHFDDLEETFTALDKCISNL